jgi:hypothetical protein
LGPGPRAVAAQFETDSDRALALARLYSHIGSAELLEKAIHIYQFLERSFEKVSVLGHLASLHRRLGWSEDALRYEEKFLELFLRRMHRASLADAARVAARVYVPIYKLEAVRFADPRRLADPLPRERAIEAALTTSIRARSPGSAVPGAPNLPRSGRYHSTSYGTGTDPVK